MKFRAWLLVWLLAATAGAQASDVSVCLYWLAKPTEVRLVPQGSTRIRVCPPCEETPLSEPLRVWISPKHSGQVWLSNARTAVHSVQVSGSFFAEVHPDTSLPLTHPLEIRASAGRLRLTVRLPLEDYVAAVLAGESASFSTEESLKAMAVAVRSYAVRYRGRHRADGFDFCDTTHCQDFRLSAASDRLQAAAEATEGELLWHEGQPAATYYHRNCGGMTEASDRVWGRLKVPYLPGQVDSYCVRRGREEWHSEISKEDLQRALAAAGVNVPGRSYSLAVVGRTPSGRVERLRLRGTVSVLIAARTLRFAVGRVLGWDRIRSDLYDLSDRGDRFVLHGHGAGHGVGLCQAGAARMGEEGKTYREILEFYYPGTKLGLTAQGISWQALATERTELLTTRPQEDQPVLALAEQLMRGAEEQSGWDFKVHPRLKVYPTVAAFRDGTARPGWVAASTRGRVIRLQPLRVLRSRRILEPTLRHELFHLLVESRAHRSLPLWFREGIVLYLAQASPLAAQAASPQGETGVRRDSAALEQLLLAPQSREEMEQAYRAARARVEALVARYGREIVLGWVERGLPPS